MERVSRPIKLGEIQIGGGAPPIIQSMITTPLYKTDDAINEAEKRGDR